MSFRSHLFTALICTFAIVRFSTPVKGQALSEPHVAYSFGLPAGLADTPGTGMILGHGGHMYGTTLSGGTDDLGTIYRFTTGGQFTRMASFARTNGAWPSSIVFGTNGMFYGTANGPAAPLSSDDGIIYRVANGRIELFVNFNNPTVAANHGAKPLTLVYHRNSRWFFGICKSGYSNSSGSGTENGTVFALSHEGIITTIHRFTGGIGGRGPNSLLVGRDGKLYGSTTGGGEYEQGTVFSLTPNGAFTLLASFGGTELGVQPKLHLQANDGWLYGDMAEGCNPRLFKLNPSGQLNVLGELSGCPFGTGNLVSSIIQTPSGLYGSASGIGASYLFRLTSEGKVVILHYIQNDLGNSPIGLLLGPDGAIYGNAIGGGINAIGNNPGGTIFRTIPIPLLLWTTPSISGFQLNWQGQSGLTYRVQSTTGPTLTNWVTITNLVATNSIISVRDPAEITSSNKFFRVLGL